jgi:hypothetical protein
MRNYFAKKTQDQKAILDFVQFNNLDLWYFKELQLANKVTYIAFYASCRIGAELMLAPSARLISRHLLA